MKTKKEIIAFLKECVNEYGDLVLNCLDLTFAKNVSISCLKVKHNLYQSDQIVGGDLFQRYQKVKGRLIQDYQGEKVYCANCNCERDFEIKFVKDTFTVRGEKVEVIVKECYCKECGESVTVDSILNENMKNVYDAYKRNKDKIK